MIATDAKKKNWRPSEDRFTSNPDGNDEFVIDSVGIDKSWQLAWPRVIARAWTIEYRLEKIGTFDYDTLKILIDDTIEQCAAHLSDVVFKSNKAADGADEIKELTESQESRYKKALEKGLPIQFPNRKIVNKKDKKFIFILKKFLNDPDIPRKDYYKRVIQGYQPVLPTDAQLEELKITREEYDYDLDWYKKLLSHKSETALDALMDEGFIIDAMENPPMNSESNFKTRIIVRKPNQSYHVEPKRTIEGYHKSSEHNDRVCVSYYPVKMGDPRLSPVMKEVEKSFQGIKKHFVGEGQKFRGARKNGWSEVNGLGHVLVLTLPPRPENPEEFGLATVDYEAAGLVYPFTACCC